MEKIRSRSLKQYKKTILTSNDVICWNSKNNYLMITRHGEPLNFCTIKDGNKTGGKTKISSHYIKTPEDFVDICILIATISGLSLEKIQIIGYPETLAYILK